MISLSYTFLRIFKKTFRNFEFIQSFQDFQEFLEYLFEMIQNTLILITFNVSSNK